MYCLFSCRPALALFAVLSTGSVLFAAESTPPHASPSAASGPAQHGVMLKEISSSAIPTNGSILGDTVDIQFLYPTMNSIYGLGTTGVVTSEGVRLNLFDNQEVIVLPNSVVMLDINEAGSSFDSAQFNGISVTDLTNPSAFTGALVGVTTDISAFGLSDVSESSGALFLNFQGLLTPVGAYARTGFFTTGDSATK